MFALVSIDKNNAYDCECRLFDTREQAHEAMVWTIDSMLADEDEGFSDYGWDRTSGWLYGRNASAEWHITEALVG